MDVYFRREEDDLDNGELMKAEIHPGEGVESPTEGSMVSNPGRCDRVNVSPSDLCFTHSRYNIDI